jgi:hypothetical protein
MARVEAVSPILPVSQNLNKAIVAMRQFISACRPEAVCSLAIML